LGFGCLKSLFRRLFSLSVSKEAKISFCGAWVNHVWVWDFSWRKGLFVWESEHVTQLLETVHLSSPSINFDDKWVCNDGDSVKYSVNSAYGFLKDLLEGDSSSLYNYFLKIKALPSAHITAWRVLQNKIATKINLARRGVAVDSTICCFCREKEEITNHLFFECRVV